MSTYNFTKARVLNRGTPPDAVLDEYLQWARSADDAIFAPNDAPLELFTIIKPQLATLAREDSNGKIFQWDSLLHRKAAMLEAMRVHAGFESSWNWDEGVDRNNAHSMANRTGQETGIFQVSFDSEWLEHALMKEFAIAHGIETPEKFIPAMKQNHPLALEYYARLVRHNIRWAGPLIRHEINPWLSRQAMGEFMVLLA